MIRRTAKRLLGASFGANLQLGLGTAILGTAGAVGLGVGAAATAGRVAGAAAYGGAQTLWNTARFFGRGKMPLHLQELCPGGPKVWPQLNRSLQWTLGLGGVALGVAGGVAGFAESRRWTLDKAILDGSLEVEKPDMLGATGSLALSLYKNQNKGRLERMGYAESGEAGPALPLHMVAPYTDDALLLLSRAR